MEKRWMKPVEIAERCGVSLPAVWAWIRRGKLKAYRFGRSYRIDVDDFDLFMQKAQMIQNGNDQR